jgi:hypothetical protein
MDQPKLERLLRLMKLLTANNSFTVDEIEKIQLLLKKEKPTHLQYDYRLAPEWIRKIMQSALKQE